MSRLTPQRLVEEFKKSGEFDILKTEALAHLMNSPENENIIARVKEIASDNLATDGFIAVKNKDELMRSLLQELDRDPVINGTLDTLLNESFKEALNKSLQKTLEATTKPSQRRGEEMQEGELKDNF